MPSVKVVGTRRSEQAQGPLGSNDPVPGMSGKCTHGDPIREGAYPGEARGRGGLEQGAWASLH